MFLMAFITEIDHLSAYPSIDTDVLRTFVAIADQGGFTRAGEMVNRTQSAVSMQMKRLEEDVLQRQLFERDGRQVRLTAEGQVLLGYARRILKLHSEVFNTLREPHMVGTVRIGTPDDYVMRFLPGILSRFAQFYPLIQIEVHCESTKQLLLQRTDLDLSIVTREPGNEIGQLLRKERFVWAEAQNYSAHEQTPLPLAMFNSDCFCRLWACNALDAMGRDYRIAYNSDQFVGADGGSQCRSGDHGATGKPDHCGHAHSRRSRRPAAVAGGQHHADAQPATIPRQLPSAWPSTSLKASNFKIFSEHHRAEHQKTAEQPTQKFSGMAWAIFTPQLMLARPPIASGKPIIQFT
jgi:DNA-binding transcriptional LysR family regulator